MLSETHLRPQIEDSQVALHGFELFRKDRTGKSCGGVAIYCYPDLRPRAVPIDTNLEMLRVDITVAAECIHVYGIYLPIFNNNTKETNISALEDHSLALPVNVLANTILIGDFNINLLHESELNTHLTNLLGNLGFTQTVADHTHDSTSPIAHAWLGRQVAT